MLVAFFCLLEIEGSNFVAQCRVAEHDAPRAVVIFRPAHHCAQPIWQFGRPGCAEMSVAVHQGEVLTDSAWRSDSFLPKHCAEGALKACQLQLGVFCTGRRRSAPGVVVIWLTGAQCAHVTKTSQAGFQSVRHISMQ